MSNILNDNSTCKVLVKRKYSQVIVDCTNDIWFYILHKYCENQK